MGNQVEGLACTYPGQMWANFKSCNIYIYILYYTFLHLYNLWMLLFLLHILTYFVEIFLIKNARNQELVLIISYFAVSCFQRHMFAKNFH